MREAENEFKGEMKTKNLYDRNDIDGGTEWIHVEEDDVEDLQKLMENVVKRINYRHS